MVSILLSMDTSYILWSHSNETVYYWHKNRHMDQWNEIEDPNLSTDSLRHLLFDKTPKHKAKKRICLQQQMVLWELDVKDLAFCSTVMAKPCSLMLSLFTLTRKWKRSKCLSADQWIVKTWCTYILEYSSATQKMRP